MVGGVRRAQLPQNSYFLPCLLQAGETFVLPAQIQDSWEPAAPGWGEMGDIIKSHSYQGKEGVCPEEASGNGLPRPITC